jgi:type II secretory ATPase GspE/PulE/Tfp pilus assembly ATPase PilB-like protein
MTEVIEWAVSKKASDIHFNVQRLLAESSIWFTIGGRYVCPPRYAHIPTATMLDMLAVTWMEVQGGNGAVFDPSIEQEGRFVRMCHGRRHVIRWASLATDAGPSVCMRLLRLDTESVAPTLAELGYLPSQVELLEDARISQGGAIILAGTVGSGKSTTIASLLRAIPPYRKVITLEDPAEYAIPNALQNSVVRSVHGDDLVVFDRKLKSIKRSAMNDLLIGEIRDQAAGRAFVDLAASGVSLYTTVHAGSALLIPERLCSSFIGIPRDFLTAPGVLKLLVYQVLLRELCPHCALDFKEFLNSSSLQCVRHVARSVKWWRNWSSGIERVFGVPASSLRFCNASGCSQCESEVPLMTGVKGRTAVAEMLSMTQDAELFSLLGQADQVAMHRWASGRDKTPYADPNMRGKSAHECALYKMSIGQIDPREIESNFGVFTEQLSNWSSRA